MRLGLRAGGVLEWLALRAGLVPVPAAEAWGGTALTGVLVAATRLGVTARLAAGPATVEELAANLGLQPVPLRLLLDCLQASGHVTRRSGRYRLRHRSRRWFDPASPLSVAGYVAGAGDYFAWWAALPEVTRTGEPIRHHAAGADDPYWRRYVTGQFELARLVAGEVASRLAVAPTARSALDVGGGHGWYSVQLCRRHPGLVATVLDLPGSARVGREIVASSGLSDRVFYREGDALVADLGGPHDLVLCFNLVHHLTKEQVPALLARLHAALAPGGSLAILDAFADPDRKAGAAARFLGLFTYLTSGSPPHSPQQVRLWLGQAGFGPPRCAALRRIPGLRLYQSWPQNPTAHA